MIVQRSATALLGRVLALGTFNTQRYALMTTGDDGTINYVVDAAHFQYDGYRFHSNAERNNFNSKLRINLSDAATLTFVANAVETPFVQDPLGLTAAMAERSNKTSAKRYGTETRTTPVAL